jgi:acyl carrier protein
MPHDEVSARLLSFIRDRFLDSDPHGELDETTPLLEWGVLNSMNTALLLNFVREEFGVAVPPPRINGRNFKDVRSISAMVRGLAVAPTA